MTSSTWDVVKLFMLATVKDNFFFRFLNTTTFFNRSLNYTVNDIKNKKLKTNGKKPRDGPGEDCR